MADETPKFAEGGIIPAGKLATNTTDHPEKIVTDCGYHRWLRTELDDEGGDEQRE